MKIIVFMLFVALIPVVFVITLLSFFEVSTEFIIKVSILTFVTSTTLLVVTSKIYIVPASTKVITILGKPTKVNRD
jgi:hypothetical protein